MGRDLSNPRFMFSATLAATLAATITLSGCSSTASSSSNPTAVAAEDPAKPARTVVIRGEEEKRAAATRTGEVYLMRGLMDIFSRGIDVLAVKLRRKGVYAVDTSYTEWKEWADDIIARSKTKDVSYPVIIMGHSLGGNDASKMASYLGANGVKVDYVVAFDPTEPGYVGKNVGKVVNYYLPNGKNRIRASKGFRGKLHNIDVSDYTDIAHTNVEKNPKLQARVIANVVKMTRKKRRRG